MEKIVLNYFRKAGFIKDVENEIKSDEEWNKKLTLHSKVKYSAKNGEKFRNHSDFPETYFLKILLN